jgi:hypothetical protein
MVCVFITAVPITKLFARGGGRNGGHVLRETTSRGLCELVCPSEACVECVYYCSTYYKAVRVCGGGNNGGHVLRETTSRGLCGLV